MGSVNTQNIAGNDQHQDADHRQHMRHSDPVVPVKNMYEFPGSDAADDHHQRQEHDPTEISRSHDHGDNDTGADDTLF